MAAGLSRPRLRRGVSAVAKSRHAALVALVLIDAFLKAGAWAFLRHRSSPAIGKAVGEGLIRLGYVENRSGFGFDQTRLLAEYGISTNDAFVACILVAFLVLALAIYLWHRVEIRVWIKTAAAAALYLAAATAALSLHDSISVSFSPYLRGLLRALGPLAVAIVLYVTVSRRYYEILSLIFLAGTVGNCVSLVLPPFTVIDYFGIYRPAIRGYVYANAADAYLVAAAAMIVLIPAYLVVRAATRSARRRASSA